MRLGHLFFDMNSYFASVAQAEEPQLRGRPVGIVTAESPSAALIAASYEAKAFGIGMGTRQREAEELCPQIVFRPAKHDIYVDYHHAILKAVDTVIPIHQIWSIDECSCLLMGSQQELERALQIGRDLQAAILQQVSPALRCSVGVAPNRFLAKIAAELKKPAGLNWLSSEVLPEKISHLALDDIPGISKRMRGRLEAAGVMSVETLHALPPKQARAIWGNVTGERLVRELRGEEAVWPETKRSMIGHGQVLTKDNRTPEGARLVTRRLLIKAATRLRREGFHAGSLYLGLRYASGYRYKRGGDIRATQDTFFLLDVLARYWAQAPRAPVKSVSIALGALTPDGAVMDDLFAPDQSREQACRAMDALNQRFGKDTVRLGQLPPHHVPYTGAKIAFGRIPSAEDFNE